MRVVCSCIVKKKQHDLLHASSSNPKTERNKGENGTLLYSICNGFLPILLQYIDDGQKVQSRFERTEGSTQFFILAGKKEYRTNPPPFLVRNHQERVRRDKVVALLLCRQMPSRYHGYYLQPLLRKVMNMSIMQHDTSLYAFCANRRYYQLVGCCLPCGLGIRRISKS